MPIEIRELLIKVKIEDSMESSIDHENIEKIKQSLLKDCKKEIEKQLKKLKQR